MFYTTISLIKYLCMCLLNKYYRNCGDHHDSDRIAVLVMVSKAESIVYIILYYRVCILAKIKISFLPWQATIFGSSVLHPE